METAFDTLQYPFGRLSDWILTTDTCTVPSEFDGLSQSLNLLGIPSAGFLSNVTAVCKQKLLVNKTTPLSALNDTIVGILRLEVIPLQKVLEVRPRTAERIDALLT